MSAPSLLRLFEPPEDFDGLFGWVCGFSADAGFLDAAAERFTRNPGTVRARNGQLVLGIMLDPFHEPISVVDVPGVADLPLRSSPGDAFRLMHAKVALLGFRNRSAGWRLRVIISTGNWTRQTLEESVDLAWSFDVEGSELEQGDTTLAQRCADVVKANEILDWLRRHYDQSLVQLSGRDCETSLAVRGLATWVALCADHVGVAKSRIFDNREKPLLDGLTDYLREYAGNARRNVLALGSGFFEGGDCGGVPPVLAKIVHQVQALDLLTQSASVDVYVNEKSCQSVATSIAAIEAIGWRVRAPAQSLIFGADSSRSLHAKFIFSANFRTEACTSAWLYLGSGNLTPAGFLNRAGRAGNFEVGVYLDFLRLPWSAPSGTLSLETLLPLQRNGDGRFSQDSPPSKGEPMPPKPPPFVAGPAAFLQWRSSGVSQGLLALPAGAEIAPSDLCVLDGVGEPCPREGEGWLWSGKMPRQVALRWDDGLERASVPVVDELGRVAAGEAPVLELDDLASHLMAFPARADDGGDGDREDEDSVYSDDSKGDMQELALSTAKQGASSPVRTMLVQLEEIAKMQTMVSEVDWPYWCVRLEEVLLRATGSEGLAEFMRFGVNPLEVLRIDASRPSHACIRGSASAARHDATLDRVTMAWGVSNFHSLREMP